MLMVIGKLRAISRECGIWPESKIGRNSGNKPENRTKPMVWRGCANFGRNWGPPGGFRAAWWPEGTVRLTRVCRKWSGDRGLAQSSRWETRRTMVGTVTFQILNEWDFFFFCCCTAWLVGSSFPDQPLHLGPWQWKHWVPTTGPPGNSLQRIELHWVCVWMVFLRLPANYPSPRDLHVRKKVLPILEDIGGAILELH